MLANEIWGFAYSEVGFHLLLVKQVKSEKLA